MKTLQDLVDRINAIAGNVGEFSVFKDFKDEFYLSCKHDGKNSRIVCFDTESGEFYRENGFCILNWEAINLISDYVINHTSADWFAEKKYNIIIGQEHDEIDEYFTAYRKYLGYFSINDETQRNELKHVEYLFTEGEIKQLKSKLPENMAKIVDLGKVEVKDD